VRADPATAAIGSWVCQHRDPFIAPLLGFPQSDGGAETITNFWSQGKDQIALVRGAKGSSSSTALPRLHSVLHDRAARRHYATCSPAPS